MYHKITLPNSLRILSVAKKNTNAVTVLVLVATGSKYETKELNGISHFLEHMFFKGTKKRPNTLAISETLDRVGGVYNAFTSKEYTGYFAKTDKQHFDLALDWVSDILLHSKMEPREINRERGVIIEELNMYIDTPMKYVRDVFEDLLYGDQPAGWSILGSKDNVLKFQQADFLRYLNNHYSTANTLVCVAGNFDQKKVLGKIKQQFRQLNTKSPQGKIKTAEYQLEPQVRLHFKKTDQTHLCLGARGYDLFSQERYAQEILATILGGNMSSRLFIKVREKNGLAYYVRTESETFTDSGYVVTQAGIPHQKVEKVVGLILKEYQALAKKPVRPSELKKAKDYLKGTLTLSLEPSDAEASFYAGQELLTGQILTLEQECAKIDKISASDVQKIAQQIFRPANINLAVIGPHKNSQRLKRILLI